MWSPDRLSERPMIVVPVWGTVVLPTLVGLVDSPRSRNGRLREEPDEEPVPGTDGTLGTLGSPATPVTGFPEPEPAVPFVPLVFPVCAAVPLAAFVASVAAFRAEVA